MTITEIVGMTGDPTCDCRHCGCSSGFHDDGAGECDNCRDEGKECPGFEPMEEDDDDL